MTKIILVPDKEEPNIVNDAPQELSAAVLTTDENNVVKLSWIDASDNETGFRVERRLSGSDTWIEIVILAADSTTYEDNNVDFDQTYEYRVVAVDAAGGAVTSNVVTVESRSAPAATNMVIVQEDTETGAGSFDLISLFFIALWASIYRKKSAFLVRN